MVLPRRLGQDEVAGLVEHLGELRTRLVVSLVALSVGFGVAYAFHGHLITWLNKPLNGREPVTFGVAEPFTTSLKVSMYAGFALALPVILWQFWGFFAPVVKRGTERVLLACVAFASLLFAAGLVFGYTIALPAAVHFLTNYDDDIYNIQVRASSYYSFALLVLLSVGFVFELPVFILALVKLGILTTDKLRKNRPMGLFIVACIGVALPGVDPMTTVFEIVPLAILYEFSIWLAVLLDRRARRVTSPLEA
jgi:sec-independent protein translocase protein TatC